MLEQVCKIDDSRVKTISECYDDTTAGTKLCFWFELYIGLVEKKTSDLSQKHPGAVDQPSFIF